LRNIDNLPEDEREALLAEILQAKIDQELLEYQNEFHHNAQMEIDFFWDAIYRQHDLKYEYLIGVNEEINAGWSNFDF
jgi:hypothetical protein